MDSKFEYLENIPKRLQSYHKQYSCVDQLPKPGGKNIREKAGTYDQYAKHLY